MTRPIQLTTLLATGALLALSVSVAAQETTRPVNQTTEAAAMPTSVSDEDIQMLRADIRAKRKQFVAANIPLTAEEAKRFWPLFDQYTEEVRKINDKRWAMMKEYAASYRSMTDEQAKGHVQKSAAVDAELIALRAKYMPQFEKRVSAQKAAQFYQIDRRLDLLMNLQLTSLLPVIETGE